MIHYFTSAATNYLPKARVLARSVKAHHPEGCFTLLLCDDPPPGFDLANEPFDRMVRLPDLSIPDVAAWTFKHSVVELCTAVKGAVLHRLLIEESTEMVIYLDPDMRVLSSLDGLHAEIRRGSIALTPHCTRPEETLAAIERVEINTLIYGVFNLGFVGVRPTDQGLAFAHWWRDRLLAFCYDEKERGLFTDQRWCDLVPCLFEDVAILRSPAYNLCHWNVPGRSITQDDDGTLLVDGEPVAFFHFSGFDWALDLERLPKDGAAASLLVALRDQYAADLDFAGHAELRTVPAAHGVYSDGETVTMGERIYYRARPELAERFPEPLSVPADGSGYRGHYRREAPTARHPDLERVGLTATDLTRLLDEVYRSWSWRIGQAVTAPARVLMRWFGAR